MEKRKRSIESNVEPIEEPFTWMSFDNSRIRLDRPAKWRNMVLDYHEDFLARNDFRQRESTNKNRMANVVPWLMSMTLLGFHEFATLGEPQTLSRELQAPELPQPDLRSQADIFRNPINGMIPSLTNSVDGIFSGSKGFSRGPFLDNRLEFRGFPQARYQDEYVGPAMELMYGWTFVDFNFRSIEERDEAIFNGDYIAENNLPLGLAVWKNMVFLTLPKWRDGIPATLVTVPRHSKTKSPKLQPYPNWEWNQSGNCEGFTSVFRIQVDECDRLWVLDSGKINISKNPTQVCPPALFIFDLQSDQLIRRYTLPEDQNKEDSLYTNIVVDIRDNNCGSAVAYLSDVFRYGLVVYDFFKDSSFRLEHHFFYPDPLAAKYDLHGVKFRWTDGIFSLALSPVDIHGDRTLFFHPMSSFREFAVSTSILRNKRTAEDNPEKFLPIGRPRAKDYGHSSGSVIDDAGVMFFNMVTRDSVWCWDTRKEYIPQNLGVVGTSNVSMVFPNDIKVDREDPQNFWVISNKLPMYLYGSLDPVGYNYRVFKARVQDAVKDTVCDPNYVVPDSEQGYDETC